MADNRLNINITATDSASPALNKVQGELRNTSTAGGGLTSAFGGMTGAASAFSAAISAVGLQMLARQLIDTAVQSDKLRNSMTAATGSAAQGAAELDFVRKTSNTLGLDLLSTAEAYTKLAAAAKGTALEGQATRDIFTAVAGASNTLGLSAEQTAGALTAIQQMISKGNVSAEELRGQLGERLPGSFNIAARAIGVTTQELDKMLKKGEVIAADFLPKFATELTKSFGATEKSTNSAQAALNRFNTSVFEMKTAIVDNGGSDAVISLANAMTGLNKIMTDNILTGKEYKLWVWNFFSELGIMMDGGPLGSNWLSKSGRAEIGAELDAQQQLYDYKLQQVAEQRAGLVRARSFPAAPGGGGGGGGGLGGSVKATGTRTPASFFGAAWDDAAAGLAFEDATSGGFNTDMKTNFGSGTAAPLSILGPGGAEAWLAQAQSDREIKQQFLLEMDLWERELMVAEWQSKEAGRMEDLADEERVNQMKRNAALNTTSAMMNLTNALFVFSGKKNKDIFNLNKAAGIANATVSTYQAAAQTLKDVPYPYNIAAVASVIAAGMVQIANISSTSFESGGNAAAGGYGSGTPSSPIITQPVTTPSEPSGNITINVQGNIIGEDKWVEENLIPAINMAASRNVTVNFGGVA